MCPGNIEEESLEKQRCKWAGTDPSNTDESIDMSIDLKKRGFKFAGPTICYAFMQAGGMVNDHTVDCFRYHEIQGV